MKVVSTPLRPIFTWYHLSGKCDLSGVRPWPNDSLFHSIFSSTSDLKAERLLCVVKYMWPNGSIFRSTFLSTFNYSYFRNACQRKIFTITNICLLNETLLRMVSLDLLDKVDKRLNFHSTILLLDFFTQHHSTPLDSLNKVAKRLDFFLDFLSSKKSSEKLSRLARALERADRSHLPKSTR